MDNNSQTLVASYKTLNFCCHFGAENAVATYDLVDCFKSNEIKVSSVTISASLSPKDTADTPILQAFTQWSDNEAQRVQAEKAII